MIFSREDKEWIDAFCNLHYLKTYDEAIHKLIEIHKAWNDKIFGDVNVGNGK